MLGEIGVRAARSFARISGGTTMATAVTTGRPVATFREPGRIASAAIPPKGKSPVPVRPLRTSTVASPWQTLSNHPLEQRRASYRFGVNQRNATSSPGAE